MSLTAAQNRPADGAQRPPAAAPRPLRRPPAAPPPWNPTSSSRRRSATCATEALRLAESTLVAIDAEVAQLQAAIEKARKAAEGDVAQASAALAAIEARAPLSEAA
jgi:hypothetical protein